MQNAVNLLVWLQTTIAMNPQLPANILLQYITQSAPQEQINHLFGFLAQAFPQFCQSFPGVNPVQIAYQALPLYGRVVAAPGYSIHQQVPVPQQHMAFTPRTVPQQSVQQAVSLIHSQRTPVQQSAAHLPNSVSPTLTNSSSDDSDRSESDFEEESVSHLHTHFRSPFFWKVFYYSYRESNRFETIKKVSCCDRVIAGGWRVPGSRLPGKRRRMSHLVALRCSDLSTRQHRRECEGSSSSRS